MTFSSNVVLALFIGVLIAPAQCDVRCELFDVDVQYEQDLPPGLAGNPHRVHCQPEGSVEMFEVTDLPPGFSVSENPFVDIIGGTINRETAKVHQPPGSYISALKRPQGDRRSNLRRRTGDKSVLVVRVVASDASTTASSASLSDSVFGTNGDPVNLKTQYAACSHNQLRFNAYSGATVTGQNVANGVVEVTISNTVAGQSDGVIRNAVTSALQSEYGSVSQWDHVMYCLPPGTSGSWIAYAYVNSWNSVYNNQWCTYVSAQLHELGHNIGLAHSNEGASAYADQSGMMGFSYSQDDGPVMCFNNAKNWQLGWFADCQATVVPSAEGASTLLVGAAEYSTTTQCGSNEAVVLKVPVPGTQAGGPSYFVGYNKKVGANAGTVEAGNQVTVQRTASEPGYVESDLSAKLAVGGEALLEGVYIKFCDLVGGKAVVGVGTSSNPCPSPLCGNGVLNDGEECDDGNVVSNDGCSRTCAVEVCGDNIVNGVETCDDGNTVSGDGCSDACVAEVCGDGIINNGEECDGLAGTPPACSDGCSGSVTCGSNCRWNSQCADGICDATEALSACPVAGNTCADCVRTVDSACGDGVCDISLDAFGRAKEDSVNCNIINGGDCQGTTGGKPSDRFYCGNDASGSFVGCDDSRCTECAALPEQSACCGDGVCAVDSGETAVNCGADCVAECVGAGDCDDGLFCTVDTCNGGVCVHGADPCASGRTCNEATDTCDVPVACTVSADFPNCCCDDSLSQLGGRKADRTCYDSGSLYVFGQSCPANAGAASVSGPEQDAAHQSANVTAPSSLTPTATTLLAVVVVLSVAVVVLAVSLAAAVRQRRQPEASQAVAVAPGQEAWQWGPSSSLCASQDTLRATKPELVNVNMNADLEAAPAAAHSL